MCLVTLVVSICVTMDGTGSRVVDALESEFLARMSAFEARLQSALDSEGGGTVTLEKLRADFVEFRGRTVDCLKEVRSVIAGLDERVDDLEAYSRRNCLLIHGIPENVHEITDDVVIAFLNKELQVKDVNFGVGMLDRSHRLGPPKRRDESPTISPPPPRPIIVKFLSYNFRSLVWNNKKQLKGKKFFISESLTARRLRLYLKAKAVVGPRNTWTSDGRVFVALSKDNRKMIRRVFDLDGYPPPKHTRRINTRSQATRTE